MAEHLKHLAGYHGINTILNFSEPFQRIVVSAADANNKSDLSHASFRTLLTYLLFKRKARHVELLAYICPGSPNFYAESSPCLLVICLNTPRGDVVKFRTALLNSEKLFRPRRDEKLAHTHQRDFRSHFRLWLFLCIFSDGQLLRTGGKLENWRSFWML